MKKGERSIPSYLKPTAASKAKELPLVKKEEKKETQKKPVLVKKEVKAEKTSLVLVRVNWGDDL